MLRRNTTAAESAERNPRKDQLSSSASSIGVKRAAARRIPLPTPESANMVVVKRAQRVAVKAPSITSPVHQTTVIRQNLVRAQRVLRQEPLPMLQIDENHAGALDDISREDVERDPFQFDAPMWHDFSTKSHQMTKHLIETALVSPGAAYDIALPPFDDDDEEQDDVHLRWFEVFHGEHENDEQPPLQPLLSSPVHLSDEDDEGRSTTRDSSNDMLISPTRHKSVQVQEAPSPMLSSSPPPPDSMALHLDENAMEEDFERRLGIKSRASRVVSEDRPAMAGAVSLEAKKSVGQVSSATQITTSDDLKRMLSQFNQRLKQQHSR